MSEADLTWAKQYSDAARNDMLLDAAIVARLEADNEMLAKALAPFVAAFNRASGGDARTMREGVGSYHFQCASEALAAHNAHLGETESGTCRPMSQDVV